MGVIHSFGTRDFGSRRQFLKLSGAIGAGALLSSPFVSPTILSAQGLPKPGPADWPRFGCDLHNSRFNAREKIISPQNAARLKQKWTFEVGGPVQNTPAVVGDTLYIASWDGFFYSLDSSTGKPRWKYDAGVPANSNGWHELRSSPQYEGGFVYFGDGDSRIHCVNAATGKVVWKTLLDENPIDEAGAACSVSVYKGLLFVGTASGRAQFFCLDAKTGKVRWKFQVVPTTDSGGGGIWTSPAIDQDHDVVYIGTGNTKGFMPPGPMMYAESMLAFDMNTGELLWYNQAREADVHDLDFSCHAMLFEATHPRRAGAARACVGAGKKDGFYCFDRYTGERYWRTMLTNGSSAGGPELNSTAVANNRVFVVSNAIGPKGGRSVTAGLHAYTGEIEWWNGNDATHMAPLATANNVLYQGFTDGLLEALDTETGRSLWQFKLPSLHRGGVAVANGVIYTSNGETTLGSKPVTDRHFVYAFSIDGK